MTSEFTLTPTKKFFDENSYFGLDPANVVLFEQRMIPAVSLDGKIILQDRGKLAMAPGGCWVRVGLLSPGGLTVAGGAFHRSRVHGECH